MDYEQRFANELGLAVIPKPKVSLWMILIPMYFVFHIYRHKNTWKVAGFFPPIS